MKHHKKLLHLEDGVLEITVPEGVSHKNLNRFLKEKMKAMEKSYYGLELVRYFSINWEVRKD